MRLDGEYLRCGDCDMNILQMKQGNLYTVDDIISSAVRHLSTTAHKIPLSGRGLPDGTDNSAVDIAGSNRRSRRTSDLVH